MSELTQSADLIRNAVHLVAFTGAGISVESGISPFRGEGGIWNRYDPRVLDLSWFYSHPEESWLAIREIFYDSFSNSGPNDCHYFLAGLEDRGILHYTITQNIDDLHYRAGSRKLAEYHGNARQLVCMKTGKRVPASSINLASLTEREFPPMSPDGGLYKPDFVFFGEGIPPQAAMRSEQEALSCDVMLVIGSTGEVYPAAGLPVQAKRSGAKIIEINPRPSAFTASITDIRIPMKAAEAARALAELLDMEIPRND